MVSVSPFVCRTASYAELDPATQNNLHRRAAQWYTDQQFFHDAIRHAQAAQSYDLMAELLEQSYKRLLWRGELVSLMRWLEALPPAYQTPRLHLACAWASVYTRSLGEIRQMMDVIHALAPQMDDALHGEMLAVEAIYTSLYGRPQDAVPLATKALPLIAPDDFLTLAAAHHALGNAHRSLGDLDTAVAAYTQARTDFEQLGDVYMAQLPTYRIAHIQIMQGRLHQGLQTYESVRQRALAAGREPLISTGEIFSHLSDLYLEWNDLEQAYTFAQQEIELVKSGNFHLHLVAGYLALAAVLAAQGNAEAARETLYLAETTAVLCHSDSITAQVAMHRAQHECTWGNVAAATAWADAYAAQHASGQCVLPPLLMQSADLLLARIRFAQGRLTEATELIQAALPPLAAASHERLVVEATILQALVCQKMGEQATAQKAMIHALTLAEPEGYVRTFLNVGPAILPMLTCVRHLFPAYVSRLLAEFPGSAAHAKQPSPLADPLTERELEILALIARGHSNRQIADDLFISVGTVKGHINHIFSKLGVENRTQATVYAQKLDLLHPDP